MVEQGNTTTFNDLKAYEARRRLAYSAKLDSTSLYWKSYLDLIQAALSETGRAQRLVLGTCRAHLVYANALAAMQEDDFRDEKGSSPVDKQQKRVLPPRQPTKPSTPSKTRKSILSEIRTAQQTMTDKFRENATNMDEEIADAITSLLDDVQRGFSTLEAMGSAVLAELEKTEAEVTMAWGRYLSKADATPKSALPSKPKSPQDTNTSGNLLDTWVVETQYRVGVAYQNAAWERAGSKLDELFREVKTQEIIRRMNLREFLVAFVQRQQRLFLSLPSIHNSVLQELVGKKLSTEEIERDLKALLKDDVDSHVAPMVGSTDLDSPLTSDLLAHATVVERRPLAASGVTGIGNTSDWKIALAVMTADCYLHFFELEEHLFTLATSPNSIFQELMPDVVVPTAENLTAGKSNFSRGWSDSLTPSDSMVLAKCVLHDIDETTFTLVERGGGGNAASKMFGKMVDKKVQVRLNDQIKKDDFVKALMTEFQ